MVEFGTLFQDGHFVPCSLDTDSCCQSTQTRPNDHDVECQARHLSGSLRRDERKTYSLSHKTYEEWGRSDHFEQAGSCHERRILPRPGETIRSLALSPSRPLLAPSLSSCSLHSKVANHTTITSDKKRGCNPSGRDLYVGPRVESDMVWTFLFLRNVILHILCRVVHALEVAAALDGIPIELKLWDADQS